LKHEADSTHEVPTRAKDYMSQPSFGVTASTHEVADRWNEYNLDFYDLHFANQLEQLPMAMDICDRLNTYVLNFERAPIGWVPPKSLTS
jgi:hypothetical protein